MQYSEVRSQEQGVSIQKSEVRSKELGVGSQESGVRINTFTSAILNSVFWILDSGFWIQKSECK